VFGIGVTSRWLTRPTPALTGDAWRGLAVVAKAAIERADALVLFAEPNGDRGGGRHVEFGIAFALGKRVIVSVRLRTYFSACPKSGLLRIGPLPDSSLPRALSAPELKRRLKSNLIREIRGKSRKLQALSEQVAGAQRHVSRLDYPAATFSRPDN
jgi:hypothetical protein